MKDLKEHDSTLFQFNGLALKQGNEFAHSFNVKQIEFIEAKLTKVTQDMEAIENKKKSYDSIFKGILKQHINKRRRKKEHRRKSNERKRKRTENNVQRVYGIYVRNPLANDLPQCLVYPHRLAIPEECIKAEGCCHIVILTRWAIHGTVLGRELFHQCCKKQNHHQP